jgi:hypothetical protein
MIGADWLALKRMVVIALTKSRIYYYYYYHHHHHHHHHHHLKTKISVGISALATQIGEPALLLLLIVGNQNI